MKLLPSGPSTWACPFRVARALAARGLALVFLASGALASPAFADETTGGAPLFGGVPRDLTLEDTEALVRYVRQIRRVAPLSIGEAPARFGSKRRDITVVGTTPDMMPLRKLRLQWYATRRTWRVAPPFATWRPGQQAIAGTRIPPP